MPDKLAPNSLDGPPPATLRKAKPSLSDLASGRASVSGLRGGMDDMDEDDPLGGDVSASPTASGLMGLQMAEQGVQMIMGAFPDIAPMLQQGLMQLKQLVTQTVAAQSTGPANPMMGMGAGGVGAGGMAAGMMPPGGPGGAPMPGGPGMGPSGPGGMMPPPGM